MAFSTSIKTLREKLNLSQKDFANRLGVNTGTIAEWESGECEPTLNQLAKISEEFKVSLDDLVSDNINTVITVSDSNKSDEPKNDTVIDETKEKDINKNTSEKKEKTKIKKYLPILIASILFVVIAIGVIAFIFTRKTSFSDDTNAISKAEASVVKVFCYDYSGKESCTGSGFFAFDNQTVVTNYHVASEGYTIKVATGNEVNYEVESVITYNTDKDIAILKLSKPADETPLTFGDSDELKKGENVTAIGSPLGIKNSISTGDFSGRVPSKNSEFLQFTASISPGSSGGALFNDKGEVVGVTSASYEEGQNLNLAIPINYVSEIYDSKKLPTKTDVINSRKYPYIDYLKDAREITIKEINENPKNNYGRCILKQVYISSFNATTIENSTEAFLTDDISKVSGDFNFDNKQQDESKVHIEWNINGESLAYYDKSMKPGSLVNAIISYDYWEQFDFISIHGKALIGVAEK